MEITFLGVGEACDSEHGNTAVLVQTKSGAEILLDCGFSVPHRFFNLFNTPDQLDGVWISHFHGDHYFGLPLLLLRFWEMGRSKPLTIIGQQGIEDTVLKIMDMAYPGFADKLVYDLRFRSMEPDTAIQLFGLAWQATLTVHSQPNLGLLLQDDNTSLYYSGDGRPSESVQQLVKNCDFAIHEAFFLQDTIPNHGSIESCLELVRQARIKRMALVHLERSTRAEQHLAISALLEKHPQVLLPEENDHVHIQGIP